MPNFTCLVLIKSFIETIWNKYLHFRLLCIIYYLVQAGFSVVCRFVPYAYNTYTRFITAIMRSYKVLLSVQYIVSSILVKCFKNSEILSSFRFHIVGKMQKQMDFIIHKVIFSYQTLHMALKNAIHGVTKLCRI